MLARQGAFFRWRANRHKVLHWRGTPKPWLLAPPWHALVESGTPQPLARLAPWELSRAYAYLGGATMLSGGAASATPCARRLWAFRRAIEDDHRFHDLPPFNRRELPAVAVW